MSNQTVHFSDIRKKIIENIENANKEIIVAVAWFTDKKIINSLQDSIDRGVKVSIIFYDDKINDKELFKDLFYSNADIRVSKKLMHNKFCVIDNLIVINGSYNWTQNASSNNENIQITISQNLAIDFKSEYEKIYHSTQSIRKHFADNEESFNRYLKEIEIPYNYPVFYKIELNNELKFKIFPLDGEKETLNTLHHIYKLFFNKEEFLEEIKLLYTFHYTNNYRNIHISLSSYIERQNFLDSFLAIDLIKYSDLSKITSLTSLNYIEENIRFSQDKIIYIDEFYKKNILIVGLKQYSKDKFEKKLSIISININDVLNKEINEIEFTCLDQNNEYLIAKRETYIKFEPSFSIIKHAKVQNDLYIKKENFKFDLIYSNQIFEENKIIIKDQLINEYNEKRNERIRIHKNNSKGDCYVATLVYGDINHPKVEFLRVFRDKNLYNHKGGRIFIKYYYRYSPSVVDKLKNQKVINFIIKISLDTVIRLIKMINSLK